MIGPLIAGSFEEASGDDALTEDHHDRFGDPASAGRWLADARVLLVDDSRMMRAVLKKALGEIGFQNVVEAVDGREAVAW